MVVFEAIGDCIHENNDVSIFPWKISKKYFPKYIRLWKQIDFEDIGQLVAMPIILKLSTGDLKLKSEGYNLIEELLKIEFDVVGGIRIIDIENNKTILPGCCCGLRDWRDWLEFEKSGRPFWMGHDPSPGIEINESFYRIWSGYIEGSEATEYYIDINKEQFHENLIKLERDLNDFLDKLKEWATIYAANDVDKLVNKFNETLNISKIFY